MRPSVERRRFRRAELDVAVDIRPAGQRDPTISAISGQVKDVSLAGVYCFVSAPCQLKAGDEVNCSISIPEEQSRVFPFSRVLGRGCVVRVDPNPAPAREASGESRIGEGEPLVGLALSFAPDVMALGRTAGG